MDFRTPRTILLVPEKWTVVDALREKYQLKSVSAAVDLIVAEWQFFGPERKEAAGNE